MKEFWPEGYRFAWQREAVLVKFSRKDENRAIFETRPGVYVVMHGRVYPADRVRKDHLQGRFVWRDRPER